MQQTDESKALPKWLLRSIACLILAGQVLVRILKGKVHIRNTLDQLKLVGPRSLGVALLTAGFVGMVFTIQVCSYPNAVRCGPVKLSLLSHRSHGRVPADVSLMHTRCKTGDTQCCICMSMNPPNK